MKKSEVKSNLDPIFRIDDKYRIKGIGSVGSGMIQDGIISVNDKLLNGAF